jgi:hypothetical protein
MTGITELKDNINIKTINLVLLSMVTFGIYNILWLNDNYKIIDKVTKIKTADNNFIIWLATCIGLSGLFFDMADLEFPFFEIIGNILWVAFEVLYIVWAFRAKKALQEYALNNYKIDLKMNTFYVFLFNILYINYCINELAETQPK